MIEKIKGDLLIMKREGLKPNYAAMSRESGLDWRTIKKYDNGYIGKPKTRAKPSKLDKYYQIIKKKFGISRTTMRSIYEFLVDEYGLNEIGSYSNFKSYVKKHNLKKSFVPSAHGLYETEYGDLAQVDWKEEIHMVSKNGEVFVINIFHIVLKASRYDYIEVTLSRDKNTLFRCLINAFRFYTGVPKRILFDNMSTVVIASGGKKTINKEMKQFAKDMGFEIQTCKVRTPQTKGTNEARNKILDWFRPYNHEFEDFTELMKICQNINEKMNMQACQGTGIPPALLFHKEKEYLTPLVNDDVIDTYLAKDKVKVSSSSLIYYKNIKYSVDPKLIGEYVEIEEFDYKLYVYYKGKLETIHVISTNPINYHENHYKEVLKNNVKDEDIEAVATKNLEMMDKLLEIRSVYINKDDACESLESLAAYLASKKNNNWIIRTYAKFDINQKNLFLEEMRKLLPYVKDEEQLFYAFKHTLDVQNINLLRFNICFEQSFGNYDVLDDKGYELFCDELSDEFKERYIEICESLKGCEKNEYIQSINK